MTDRSRGRLTTGALNLFTERFRALYERSLLAVYVHNFEGHFVDANDAALALLGYSREEVAEVNFADLLQPEDLPRAMGIIKELFRTGGQHEVTEFALRRKDGSLVWVETEAVVLYEQGEPVAVQGIARDISGRKEAEAQLRESERMYRLLAENVSDVIWTADLDFNYTYFSPSVFQMTGFTPEERYRQTQADILTPESFARTQRVLREEMARVQNGLPDRTRTMDLEIYRKDGSTVMAEVTVRFLLDDDGKPTGLLGVTRDITERRRLESQVQQSQKMESLGLLAGGIAHDFNNLLMGIMGNADLALTCLPEDFPIREQVAAILTASRQAADLCKQVLSYSGRGGASSQTEPVSLSPLIAEMIGLLKSAIDKRVTLECDLAADLPAIEADPSQLRQVALNLITNAAEAIGPMEGKISVKAGLATPDAPTLARAFFTEDLEPGQACVFLEIRDTGGGMDAETRERIFDPFFTTKVSGRGLGLSAVLGIVRAHRGAVLVRSKKRMGTLFRVYLPLPHRPTRPIERPIFDDRERPWRGSGTALLVDDEPGVRLTGRRMLETLGFKVVTAADGEEGVALFSELADEVRLVLMDESMPRMSGSEAFYELRRVNPDAQVVLSSGYSIEETIQRLTADGLAAFLPKPYLIENLRATLREVLGD